MDSGNLAFLSANVSHFSASNVIPYHHFFEVLYFYYYTSINNMPILWLCIPTAQVVTCKVLMNPTFGSVTVSGRSVNSTARYSCVSGYTLIGLPLRVCQPNGVWSGEAPVCKRKSLCDDIYLIYNYGLSLAI